MRRASIICFISALALDVFAYWGLNTVGGRRAFDEMAGMVPFAAGVAGTIMAAFATVGWWLSRHRPK